MGRNKDADREQRLLLREAAGLTPRQVGFGFDLVGWTIHQEPTVNGTQWATVATDGSERVGMLLGWTTGQALEAIQRIRDCRDLP